MIKDSYLTNCKKKEYKVSIIIPAYNCEKTIINTLISIENNLLSDKKIIVIDDGSEDNTFKIVSEYLFTSKMDYILLKTKNSGVSSARNLGLKYISDSTYCCFIDADDTYTPNFLPIMVSNMEDKNFDFLTCGYYVNNKEFFLSDKNYSKEKYLIYLQSNYCFNQVWNKIFVSKIISEGEIIFPTNISIGEDEIFVLKYFDYSRHYGIVSKPLYNYCLSKNGLNFKYHPDIFNQKSIVDKELIIFFEKNNYSLKYPYNRRIKSLISVLISLQSNSKNYSKEVEEHVKNISDKELVLLKQNVSGFCNVFIVNLIKKKRIKALILFLKLIKVLKKLHQKRVFNLKEE